MLIILGVEGRQWLALDNYQVTWSITFHFMAQNSLYTKKRIFLQKSALFYKTKLLQLC